MGGFGSTTLVCKVARDKVDNWICTSSAHIILEPTSEPDDNFLLEVDKPDPDLSKRDRAPVPRRSTTKGPFDGTENTVIDFAPIHQSTRYRFVHVRGKGGTRCVLARNLSSNDVTNPAPSSPRSTSGATRKNFKPPQKPPEPKDESLRAPAATYWEVEQQRPTRTRTPDGKRDAAYQTAFAIVSPAVTFVEWTLFENYLDHPWYVDVTDPGKWLPFEYGKQRAKSWQEIKPRFEDSGERWIYVFRAEQKAGAWRIPTCVDELFLDKDGNLHVTPTEPHVRADGTVEWPERGTRGPKNARGASKSIGRSICFVRQLVDRVFEYWFFATRFQLPAKALNDPRGLQSIIWRCGPAITLSSDDPYIVDGKVPLLDPITIARALHDRYSDACDDYIKYLAPIDTSGSTSREGKERHQKVVLGELISALVDSSPVGLIGHLKSGEPTQFLNDYADQTGYREAWRDYWCMQLTKWLQSDAMTAIDQIVGRDLRPFDPAYEAFEDFFVQMAECHSRLMECPFGRGLLDLHVTRQDSFRWFALAMQEHADTPKVVQALRKEGSAVLEVLFVHAHHMIVHQKTKEFAREVLGKALRRYFVADEGKPLLIIVGNETRGWWVQGGAKGPRLVSKDKIEAARWELHKEFKNGKLAAARAKAGWKALSAIAVIELLNFVFVLHEFHELLEQNRFAAGLELTDATLELIKSSMAVPVFKKMLSLTEHGAEAFARVLGTCAALVEVVLFSYETFEAWHEGKVGKAVGSGVSAAGAATMLTGFLLGSEVVPIVGLFIVGIGFLVQMRFKDPNDYENLVTFCYFGKQNGSAHEPAWYKPAKSFAEWRDDLEEQLFAAVSLLCNLEIRPGLSRAPGDGPIGVDEAVGMRRARVQHGWIPENATLNCQYRVEWKNPTDAAYIQASIRFNRDGQLAVSGSQLAVKLDDKGDVLVEGPAANISYVDQGGYYVNPRLQAITLRCYLEVALAGKTFHISGKVLDYGGGRTKEFAAVLYGDPT